jgi:hypothetical protein
MSSELCKKKAMDIFEFAKLRPEQKEELLHTQAMLLECFTEKDKHFTIYYLPSFFVEVSTNVKSKNIIDIIPYRRGYKVESEKDKLYDKFKNKILLVA